MARLLREAGFFTREPIQRALSAYDFGFLFRAVRRSAQLTQVQLGELLELDQDHISRIESGARRLTGIAAIARVATRLGIPPALLGFPIGPASPRGPAAHPPAACDDLPAGAAPSVEPGACPSPLAGRDADGGPATHGTGVVAPRGGPGNPYPGPEQLVAALLWAVSTLAAQASGLTDEQLRARAPGLLAALGRHSGNSP